MKTIELSYLLVSVSPQYLSLLTLNEKTLPIVLRDGLTWVKEEDVKEIVEAVIMENMEKRYIH